MQTTSDGWIETALLDAQPQIQCFRQDVLAGLRQRPKRLPCKYLYDQHGSALFDAICELPEYYLTRAELGTTHRFAGEIAERIGESAMLIELGSGSSVKTRILLDHLPCPAAYVPVDISQEHLHQSARSLATVYPGLEILPVAADFTQEFELPTPSRDEARRTVYFPGSTIGNFAPIEALAILTRIGQLCGAGGGLLIGIDLQKDTVTLERAYNDAAGVTAQFSLNLLRRMNRELGADFNLDAFRHVAFYDRVHHRIDIRLVSQRDQVVHLGGHRFPFDSGEAIRTEYSYKYTVEGFAALAARAGFQSKQYWTDRRNYFGVLYLEVVSGEW